MDQYAYALFLQMIMRNGLYSPDDRRRSDEFLWAQRGARRRRRCAILRAAWSALQQVRRKSTVDWGGANGGH
jgi:hypothetical protein